MTEYIVRIPSGQLSQHDVKLILERALASHIDSGTIEVLHLVSDPEHIIRAKVKKIA